LITVTSFLRVFFGAIFVIPPLAIGLLSFSPSKGMDFFVDPSHASLKWWVALYADPTWARAAATSVSVALLSTFIAMLLTIPVVVCNRLTGMRVSRVLLTLSGFAFFLPPVVLAVGLYSLIQASGLFDSAFGLSLAHMSITIPVVGFILSERLKNSSDTGYLVARSLGAKPLSAAVTWLAASHRPSLIAAAAAAFMGSMSETTITLFITDTRVLTIVRRVMSGISQDIDPTGYAAMMVWIGLVSVGTVVGASLIQMD